MFTAVLVHEEGGSTISSTAHSEIAGSYGTERLTYSGIDVLHRLTGLRPAWTKATGVQPY